LQALAETLENGRRRIVVDVLDAGLMPAPATVAGRLEIPAGSEVVFLERRLILDGAPLSVWSSYLPGDLTGPLLDGDLSTDFYELLEKALHLELQSAQLTTEARLADESVAELLGVQTGAPILFLERLLRERSGRPVEFGFVSLRGDRIRFTARVERAGKDVSC
jgi:GntR family transcriptional regulator